MGAGQVTTALWTVFCRPVTIVVVVKAKSLAQALIAIGEPPSIVTENCP